MKKYKRRLLLGLFIAGLSLFNLSIPDKNEYEEIYLHRFVTTAYASAENDGNDDGIPPDIRPFSFGYWSNLIKEVLGTN